MGSCQSQSVTATENVRQISSNEVSEHLQEQRDDGISRISSCDPILIEAPVSNRDDASSFTSTSTCHVSRSNYSLADNKCEDNGQNMEHNHHSTKIEFDSDENKSASLYTGIWNKINNATLGSAIGQCKNEEFDTDRNQSAIETFDKTSAKDETGSHGQDTDNTNIINTATLGSVCGQGNNDVFNKKGNQGAVETFNMTSAHEKTSSHGQDAGNSNIINNASVYGQGDNGAFGTEENKSAIESFDQISNREETGVHSQDTGNTNIINKTTLGSVEFDAEENKSAIETFDKTSNHEKTSSRIQSQDADNSNNINNATLGSVCSKGNNDAFDTERNQSAIESFDKTSDHEKTGSHSQDADNSNIVNNPTLGSVYGQGNNDVFNTEGNKSAIESSDKISIHEESVDHGENANNINIMNNPTLGIVEGRDNGEENLIMRCSSSSDKDTHLTSLTSSDVHTKKTAIKIHENELNRTNGRSIPNQAKIISYRNSIKQSTIKCLDPNQSYKVASFAKKMSDDGSVKTSSTTSERSFNSNNDQMRAPLQNDTIDTGDVVAVIGSEDLSSGALGVESNDTSSGASGVESNDTIDTAEVIAAIDYDDISSVDLNSIFCCLP